MTALILAAVLLWLLAAAHLALRLGPALARRP